MKAAPLLIFVLILTTTPVGARPPFPEVTFRYSALFDGRCADISGKPSDQDAVAELQRRLPELEQAWRKDGPSLLAAVPPVTGIRFRFRETRAALILCEEFPSGSLPLMINVRPYLTSTAGREVAPMIDFTNSVFHELLHRYVTDCIEALPGQTTPLLEKYGAESQRVRNHLHLYAIEELVYRKLGREKDLRLSFDVEQRSKSGPVFARAREIVAAEGAEAFVRELQQRRGSQHGVAAR